MSQSEWQLPGIRRKARRFFCTHKNVCYGPMRDICYNCLAILDEHPSGRARLTDQKQDRSEKGTGGAE